MVWMSPTYRTDACNTIYFFLSVFSRQFNQEDPLARLKRERRQYCSSNLNHKIRMQYDSCRTCASWHCSVWSVHGQGSLTVGLLRDCSFFLHREWEEEHLLSFSLSRESRETLFDRWSRRMWGLPAEPLVSIISWDSTLFMKSMASCNGLVSSSRYFTNISQYASCYKEIKKKTTQIEKSKEREKKPRTPKKKKNKQNIVMGGGGEE